MLAGVLVLLCLALLLAELRLRGRRGYARTGGGAARPVRPVRPGRADRARPWPGWPPWSSWPWSCRWRASATGWRPAPPPGSTGRLLTATTGTTLGLAAAAAVAATAMALPTGWLAVRARGRVATLLERSTYLGSAVPGIVVALALVTLSIRATPWLYQTVPVLLAAYAILFLPRAIVTVRAAVEQSPPVYDDVAASLGASAPDRLRRVTLPLLAPGIGAGAALVFLAVVTELTATLLLAPTGTTTLATAFWSASSALEYGAAAPVRRRHGAALGARYRAAVPRRPTRSDHMSSLTVKDLTKSFTPPPRCSPGWTCTCRAGASRPCSAPRAAARPPCSALIAGFDDPDAGTVTVGRPGGRRRRPQRPRPPPRHRLRAPGGRAVPAPHGGRQHQLRPAAPPAPRRRPGARAARPGGPRAPSWPTARRTSSPAASSSGWPSPAPWRPSPPWCCSTSRSPPWTPPCARRPGSRSPTRCGPPARPPCWSPTTRPRRCRWPTRWRCSAAAGWCS